MNAHYDDILNNLIDRLQIWLCGKIGRRFQYRARLEYSVGQRIWWTSTRTISLNCQSDANNTRWIKKNLAPKGIKKTDFYSPKCGLANGKLHLELSYLGWF